MSALSELYTIPQEHLDFRDTIREIAQQRDRPAGGPDRRGGRLPARPAQAAGRAGHPGPPVRDRARRHRHRHADAQHGGRGDRQGVRVDRADPHDPGAGDATDQAVRLRGAQGPVPAPLRQRRVVPGVRAVRARGRLRPRRHAHPRRPGRRRVGDRRDQELDHQPRDRRLLRLLRRHRPRGRPLPRHHRLRGRGRPSRVQRRQARAQAGHPRLADRPADLRRRPRSRRRT